MTPLQELEQAIRTALPRLNQQSPETITWLHSLIKPQ